MRIILFVCLAIASLALQGHALAIGRLETVETISDESKTVENEVTTEGTDEITTVTPEILIDDTMTNNINDVPDSDEIETFLTTKNITKDTVDLDVYQQLISGLLKLSSRLSESSEYVIDLDDVFNNLFDPNDVEAFIEDLNILASLIDEYKENNAETEEIVDEVIIVESLPVPTTNLSKDTKTSEDMSGIDLVFDAINVLSSLPSTSDTASKVNEIKNDVEKTTEPIAEVEKPVEITV